MHSGDARKRSYLNRLTSSHLRSDELRRYVDLPANLHGRSILDIGSGTSTTALDNAESSVTFIALDLRFRDLDEMRRSSGEYFRNVRASIDNPSLKERRLQLQDALDADTTDAKRFFDDCARLPSGTYVAGDLWHLPFAGDTFDFVYSIRCLSDYYVDPDLFLDGVREALRVTKPRRFVQISPWQDDYLSLTRGQAIGSSAGGRQRALEHLREEGIHFRVKSAASGHLQYLQVLKAGKS